MSGRLSWEGKDLQLSAIHWDWWFYVKLGVFNLAHGFFKHCCHMLFVEVHLMKLLFPFWWTNIVTEENYTIITMVSSQWFVTWTFSHQRPQFPSHHWPTNTERMARARSDLLRSFYYQCLWNAANCTQLGDPAKSVSCQWKIDVHLIMKLLFWHSC